MLKFFFAPGKVANNSRVLVSCTIFNALISLANLFWCRLALDQEQAGFASNFSV
jgi:hypothetical protein